MIRYIENRKALDAFLGTSQYNFCEVLRCVRKKQNQSDEFNRSRNHWMPVEVLEQYLLDYVQVVQ